MYPFMPVSRSDGPSARWSSISEAKHIAKMERRPVLVIETPFAWVADADLDDLDSATYGEVLSVYVVTPDRRVRGPYGRSAL